MTIKFGTDILAHLRMNPADFGDPLTFSSASLAG